jgi:hypothetical protein
MARQQPGPGDVTRGPKAAGTYSRQVRQVTGATRVDGQPATAGADDGALRAHHLTPNVEANIATNARDYISSPFKPI